MLWRFPF